MTLTKEQVQPILDLINTYPATKTIVTDSYVEHLVTLDDALYQALQPIIADEPSKRNNRINVGDTVNMVNVLDARSIPYLFSQENPDSYIVVFDYTINQFTVLSHDNAAIISDAIISNRNDDIYVYQQNGTGKWMRYTNNIDDEYLYDLEPVTLWEQFQHNDDHDAWMKLTAIDRAEIETIRQFMKKGA